MDTLTGSAEGSNCDPVHLVKRVKIEGIIRDTGLLLIEPIIVQKTVAAAFLVKEDRVPGQLQVVQVAVNRAHPDMEVSRQQLRRQLFAIIQFFQYRGKCVDLIGVFIHS